MKSYPSQIKPDFHQFGLERKEMTSIGRLQPGGFLVKLKRAYYADPDKIPREMQDYDASH